MFDTYMYVSFAIMVLIFLRQISIYKQPNKINYAPLMLGIGAIASVIHFIVSPERQDIVFTLKGSLIPMLVALMLYIVMNIMHQTQNAQNERIRTEFTHTLIEQIAQMKSFIVKLEEKTARYASEEIRLRNEFMAKFNRDIEALGKLLQNQETFMEKFDEVKRWHSELTELFINFTEFKLPELDSIVHKHIEMLRITESQHYEKLQQFLETTLGKKNDIKEMLQNLTEELRTIDMRLGPIAAEVAEHTKKELDGTLERFKKEFSHVYAHAQTLQTVLAESENKLEAIKTQSEIVMKQMVLLADTMEKIEGEEKSLAQLRHDLSSLLTSAMQLRQQYEAATQTLKESVEKLLGHENEFFQELDRQARQTLEAIAHDVSQALQEMKEKHADAADGISESVKILARTHLNNPYEQR